jgi:hypothetical protein
LCHAHIICITVLEHRIISCQIFCDLLLKSAFERIFNIKYSSIIIVRNVYVLSSASMIVYLFFTRSWSAVIKPKLFFTRLWSAIIGTKQPKVNQSPPRDIYIYIFINWTLRMSDNLPERVQILCHAHIICITVLEHRIICCQIFCDLLLKVC